MCYETMNSHVSARRQIAGWKTQGACSSPGGGTTPPARYTLLKEGICKGQPAAYPHAPASLPQPVSGNIGHMDSGWVGFGFSLDERMGNDDLYFWSGRQFTSLSVLDT